MALVNPLKMIKKAQREGYAIAAFNIHNLETIQAVVEAAWEEQSPLIIQTTPGTLKHAGIPYVAACVKTAAELYDIPIALHLDHCESFETIVQCIRAGYTSVMIDSSKLPYHENVAAVKRVVDIAKLVDVAVEGEIGRIGGTEDDMTVDEREAALTIPEEAQEFAQAAGVDTLAIAIGTAHGLYKGEPKLDFERLSAIREKVEIPLVLHGGSGVSDNDIRETIRRGICKINIATELKVPMAQAIQDVFNANPEENDPRKYMGRAKEAVKEVARKKIQLCGSSGRAWEGIR
ncbi:MAG: class II fructose-1,6-bisphosphate aldolase [Caldicoprobacterales bacterium]|nr:class II fructose-1,6-bisphosphate aldolase [Clostridiales bacterium]